MTSTAVSRRSASLIIAGTLIFAPILIQRVAATSPSIKEGDKCAKVGQTTRGSSGVTFTCTRVGTTKVLKWKLKVVKPTTPTISTTSQIIIQNFAFTASGNVKSADVLSVTNRDDFTHTVTSDTGAFDVTVAGSSKKNLPSLNSGTYAFHCTIHPSMRGTLIVG